MKNKTVQPFEETTSPASDWHINNSINEKQISNLVHHLMQSLNANKTIHCFASCREGQDVSSVVSAVAQALLDNENRLPLLCVDANPVDSTLFSIFMEKPKKGLRQVLSGSIPLSQAVVSVAENRIHLLGSKADEPMDRMTITPNKISSFFASLKDQYCCTLIDCGALLTAPDALKIARLADSTLLVIQSGTIHAKVAQKVKNLMAESGCRINGVILCGLKHVIPKWIYQRL